MFPVVKLLIRKILFRFRVFFKLTQSRVKNRTCPYCHLFGRLVYFVRRTLGKCCIALSYASCVFCEEFYTACKFIQGSIPLQGTMACFCFLVWKRVITISQFYLFDFHPTLNFTVPEFIPITHYRPLTADSICQ